MATSITVIDGDDVIKDSRAVINANFDSLLDNKIETDYLDTDTTLAANSDTKIPTQKAVKAYVDTGGNVNASETNKGIVEEATDAEVTAGSATGATGAKLFITPAKLKSAGVIKFGGTGADGALSIATGTTTIDLASAAVVIKNYTSISITGDAKLAFSNPHASGTIVILKSQGNVTITSSTNPAIDVRGIGASGGAANTTGTNGNSSIIVSSTAGTAATGAAAPGVGGTRLGAALPGLTKSLPLVCGSGGAGGTTDGVITNFGLGGGGGASAVSNGSNGGVGTHTNAPNGASGAGGRGGGALLIECAGAYSCSSVINAAGNNGADATGTGDNGGSGGGGGGMIVVLYNTLTSDTGTYTVTGGSAGARTSTGGTGGGGGNGVALRTVNTEFV